MSAAAGQQVFLIRHGETEWSRSGRHTGRTDIPLSEEGCANARQIGRSLVACSFEVYVSPLKRARDTCDIAGFGARAHVDPDLREWDYGIYEGRTTLDVRREIPDWSVWLSPITGGESLEDVGQRARRVIDRISGPRDVAIFAHGHICRILAACWIGMPPLTGRHLALDTGSISVLGHERQTRVIRQWNRVPDIG